MKKVIVLGSNGQLGKTIKDFSETEAVQLAIQILIIVLIVLLIPM